MTDERDDKPDNVSEMPGARRLPPFLQRLLRQEEYDHAHQIAGVHNRAAEYLRFSREQGRPLTEELAYVAALLDDYGILRRRNEDLELRVRRLEASRFPADGAGLEALYDKVEEAAVRAQNGWGVADVLSSDELVGRAVRAALKVALEQLRPRPGKEGG